MCTFIRLLNSSKNGNRSLNLQVQKRLGAAKGGKFKGIHTVWAEICLYGLWINIIECTSFIDDYVIVYV